MKEERIKSFIIDKQNKKIIVERELIAPISQVWSAWTESGILDQWWAPNPWKARTKTMDFQEGGFWLYAMVGPEGEEHWSRVDYRSIIKEKGIQALDAFCDSNGIIKRDSPQSIWKIDFNYSANSTFVYIEVAFENLTDLEKNIEMGFKEGFTMALENLDEFFMTSLSPRSSAQMAQRCF